MLSGRSSNFEIDIDTIPMNVAVYRYEEGNFIFVDFNSMAQKTEKITKDELIGKKVTEVFPGVREFGLFDVLIRVYENGAAEEVDLGYYEDERTKGWRENRVSKLPNGNIIAFYSDLTVLKEKEDKLKGTSKN